MEHARDWFAGLLVVFVALLKLSSAQDCACAVPSLSRARCYAGTGLSQSQCIQAGCCYDSSPFVFFTPRCYARNSRNCRQNDRCNIHTNLRASCGSFDRLSCEIVGCCYDSRSTLSCYRAVTTNRPDFASVANLPVASEWRQWSSCTETCTSGYSTRQRVCLNAANQRCEQVGIVLAQRRICNNRLCHRWGGWTNGPCSVTCGRGFRQVTRSCLQPGGSVIPSSCYNRGSVSCNNGPCRTILPTFSPRPIFPTTIGSTQTASRPFVTPLGRGSWGSWRAWSKCSQDCARGSKTRTRSCLNARQRITSPLRCAVQGSPGEFQRQACNMEMCTIWSAWSPYSQCTKSCGADSVRYSLRSCAGAQRDASLTVTEAFAKCGRHEIPCAVASCPSIHTTQTSLATRPIFTIGPIPFRTTTTLKATRSTQTVGVVTSRTSTPAPQTTAKPIQFVEASWQSWLSWSGCSQECDPGERVRVRRCVLSERKTVTDVSRCPGFSLQNEVCNVDLCDEWGDWDPLSPCSVSCVDPKLGSGTANGVRTTSRICNIREGRQANAQCYASVQSCNTTTPCPDLTTRSVEPTNMPITFTLPPSASTSAVIHTIESNTPEAASTTQAVLGWERWGDWSPCSETCSEGIQTRVRMCGDTAIESCPGEHFDIKECVVRACEESTTESTTVSSATTTAEIPEQDIWLQWSEWSSCTKTCPGGTQIRQRGCRIGVPQALCDLRSLEIRDCNTNPCTNTDTSTSTKASAEPTTAVAEPPTTASSLPATSASEKTVTTPTSAKASSEPTTVVTEPLTSASTLPATSAPETSPQVPIPGQSIWEEWGDWEACSSTCSAGIQSRKRQCRPGVQPHQCVEGSLDVRSCNTGYCQIWSGWEKGSCDATCGRGIEMSKRRCSTGEDIAEIPSTCYTRARTCITVPCEPEFSGPLDPRKDILFLVDSSDYVDDCATIQEKTGWETPIAANRLNTTIAPTYTRMKQFIKDFASGWGGVSNDGSRIGIQLFSELCSPRTKANLHVEKHFNDSQEYVASYVDDLSYLCGDFWLDWALQCVLNPVFSTPSFGDRVDVPNLVVILLSNAPSTSQPSERLLRRILTRLGGSDTTVISASATRLEDLSPISRERYEANMRKLSCSSSTEACPKYIGSIWDTDRSNAAEKVREALRETEEFV